MGPAVLTLLAALSVGQLAHSTLGGSFSFPGAPPAQASSVTDWSKSGALPGYWGPGIPAPSISCVANASNGMDCTGATPTPQGSPVSVGSPFHPDGLWTSETDVPALSLNGTTDYVDLGTASAASTGLLVYGVIAPTTVSGIHAVITKDGDLSARSWGVSINSGVMTFVVFKDDTPNYSAITCAIGTNWTPFAASYKYVANGTSELRLNCNGTAATPVTNAVGPIQSTASHVVVGAYGDALYKFAGSVAGLNVADNASASDAQLATVVAAQQSLLQTRPVGAAVTWAHNESAPIFPVSDSVGYWMAPNTALVESTGAQIFGASSNLLTYSTITDAHATKDGATTIADASASCPLGPFGARMALVTPDANAHGVRMDAATGTGRGLWLALATGDSACAVTLADYADAHGAAKTLAALPHWYAGATTGDHGIAVTQPAGGCVRFCADNALAVAQTWAPVPEQFRVSAGAPFSGPASVVTEAVTLTNPARWCVGAVLTPSAWSASFGILESAVIGTANSFSLRDATGTLYLLTYNGASAQQYTAATAPATGRHTVVGCEVGTALQIYIDGVLSSAGNLDAGGPIASMPAAVHIGGHADGTVILNGSIAKVCQASTYAACARQLVTP